MVPVPTAVTLKDCEPPKQTDASTGCAVIAVAGVTVIVIALELAVADELKQDDGKLDVMERLTTSLLVRPNVVYVAPVPTVTPFNFQAYVGDEPILRPDSTENVTLVPAHIVVLVDCVMLTLGATGAPVMTTGVLVAVGVNKQFA